MFFFHHNLEKKLSKIQQRTLRQGAEIALQEANPVNRQSEERFQQTTGRGTSSVFQFQVETFHNKLMKHTIHAAWKIFRALSS